MHVVLKRKCLTVLYLGHRKEYVCFDQIHELFEIGTSKVDLQKYFYFVKSFYRVFTEYRVQYLNIKVFFC